MPDRKTYTIIAHELLSDSRVTEGNLFGVPVLKIGGKPFAGLYRKDLVVKLGIDRVQEMLRAKTGAPFDPSDEGMDQDQRIGDAGEEEVAGIR